MCPLKSQSKKKKSHPKQGCYSVFSKYHSAGLSLCAHIATKCKTNSFSHSIEFLFSEQGKSKIDAYAQI